MDLNPTPSPAPNHIPLLPEDLGRVVGRLPEAYKSKLQAGMGILAGGTIRAILANEEVQDVDIYCRKKDIPAWHAAAKLKHFKEFALGRTLYHDGVGVPLQLITGIEYKDASDLLAKFDFTICKAVIWHEKEEWKSLCDVKFYADLASKRLRYEAPPHHPFAGGSLLRMRKYVRRGYHIPADSLAQLVTDLVGVDILEEKEYHKRLELLRRKLVALDPSEGGTL